MNELATGIFIAILVITCIENILNLLPESLPHGTGGSVVTARSTCAHDWIGRYILNVKLNFNLKKAEKVEIIWILQVCSVDLLCPTLNEARPRSIELRLRPWPGHQAPPLWNFYFKSCGLVVKKIYFQVKLTWEFDNVLRLLLASSRTSFPSFHAAYDFSNSS